jgi:hypothetical protein
MAPNEMDASLNVSVLPADLFPACLCGGGRGVPTAVRVESATRIVTYRCPSCHEVWTRTTDVHMRHARPE